MAHRVVRTGAMVSLLWIAALQAWGAQPGFWAHWGDGKAELNGYRLTQHRYGQSRSGRLVAVFVTETFSESTRVKADDGQHPAPDTFPVIKLNVMEHFQTGIYDYNIMTSTFARVEAGHGMPAGSVVKVAFSSQEWCGTVFEAMWPRADGTLAFDRHSYFDAEADERGTLRHGGALLSDALWLTVRSLAAGTPAPGQSNAITLLPTLKEVRLLHRPLTLRQGRLSRAAGTERVAVPAGTFVVERFTLTEDGGQQTTFLVEASAPRRVVVHEVQGGSRAELTGTIRDAYWTHNREGDERLLTSLGLAP